MKIFNMFKNQYSQSFQKQVVIFSSVIILSEKKNTEYSCTWIYFNIFLSIIYVIWCTVRYTVREILLLYNVARSRKLPGTQQSPKRAWRSTDFCSPENPFFPALICLCVHAKPITHNWLFPQCKAAKTCWKHLQITLIWLFF